MIDTWLHVEFDKADYDHSTTLDKNECHDLIVNAMNENVCSSIQEIEYMEVVEACMQNKDAITFKELRDYIIRDHDMCQESERMVLNKKEEAIYKNQDKNDIYVSEAAGIEFDLCVVQ